MGSIRAFECQKCGIYISYKQIGTLQYNKVYIKKCSKCNYINKVILNKYNDDKNKEKS